MKKYTVGIIFNQDLSKILLILKNRPEKLKGTYNGPGGKFEDEDKDRFDCIVREVREECSLQTIPSDWKYCGVLKSEDCSVDFLTLIYAGALEDAVSFTDEEIAWVDLKNIPTNLSKNLDWIILRALAILKEEKVSEPFVFQME